MRSRSSKRRVGDQSVTVASLEDIIQSKMAAGRDKDRAVLPILRDTLKTKQALQNKSPGTDEKRERRRS